MAPRTNSEDWILALFKRSTSYQVVTRVITSLFDVFDGQADGCSPHARSVLNSWAYQGYQNKFVENDPTTFHNIFTLGSDDLSDSYGLVEIPVCGKKDLLRELISSGNPTNWQNVTSWPCPIDTTGSL